MVYEQFLLSKLYKCIADRSISVGMILHGVAHYVGNLVEPAVIDAFHCVEDTPLNRLKPVKQVGHGTFKYDIRGIVNEPCLVHPCQMLGNIAVVVSRFV